MFNAKPLIMPSLLKRATFHCDHGEDNLALPPLQLSSRHEKISTKETNGRLRAPL